jgi:hypothetical protein
MSSGSRACGKGGPRPDPECLCSPHLTCDPLTKARVGNVRADEANALFGWNKWFGRTGVSDASLDYLTTSEFRS